MRWIPRRHWPAALAFLAIPVLGSYLLYTEHLVREIRAEAEIHTEMYAIIQRGLLSLAPQAELNALVELQTMVAELGVPIVVVNAEGELLAWSNLPFPVDPEDPGDRRRVVAYARQLDAQNSPIVEPGVATVHYGPPPILVWLRWIPWLQVGGAALLLIVGVALFRANIRAERERTWAGMARELAHQMGTPLSSLAGWIELLRLPAAERDSLADAGRIAQELETDLERLGRVSRRFELIGQPPKLEPTSVVDVVRDVEEYFRPRLPRLAAGIVLRARVQRELPPVEANHVLLVWAIENLVKNALDALAGRGGRIRIAALRGPRDRVRIAVADTGPGVPPALRDRLFEPGTTTKSGGWGVGLSLTRRIIEQLHEGQVASRQRRGGGTVFEIELPVAVARVRRGRVPEVWRRARAEHARAEGG